MSRPWRSDVRFALGILSGRITAENVDRIDFDRMGIHGLAGIEPTVKDRPPTQEQMRDWAEQFLEDAIMDAHPIED